MFSAFLGEWYQRQALAVLMKDYRTSDGYALALGWEHGWAVWTVYGRLTTWAVGGDAGGAEGGEQSPSFQDRFMNGIKELVRIVGC